MGDRWSVDEAPSLSGRTAVVTGANSGIGYEAARVLAEKGAHVVLACRSRERGEAALQRLRSEHPAGEVSLLLLDLASLASVRAFAGDFRSAHGRLDLLVNNAGLMALPRMLTADGFEMQIGTNHLGHFALTGLLLGRLVESGSPAAPARVVTISSQAHRMGRVDLDDLMGERRYDRWAAYGQSKLANLLFTHELARRLARKYGEPPPILAVAAHPGYAATELQTKGSTMGSSKVEGWVMRLGNGLIGPSPADGARPTLRAALDPGAQPGDYFGPGGLFGLVGAPVRVGSTARARDPDLAARLWARSVELTGVDFAGL